MRRAARPNRSVDSDAQILFVCVFFAVAVLSCGLWLVLHLAHPPGFHGGNPLALVIELARGRIQWTGACWAWLSAVLAALALLGAAVWLLVARWQGRRTRVDHAVKTSRTWAPPPWRHQQSDCARP
jgi:hypothetical protein